MTKTILITGATSGFGRAAAGKFAAGGWRVIGTGRRAERLRELQGELLPVGKAYFGFTDEELKWLDRWVRAHTVQRFGPVREVEKSLVLEVAFDSIHLSKRHKSGLAMRFPRISRIRDDKPAHESDTIDAMMRLVT